MMISRAALVLVFAGLSSLLVQADDATRTIAAQPKIINGFTATETQFPWQVGLMAGSVDLYQSQFCSGTLIDARWVLTAAHCVKSGVNIGTNTLHVLAGISNLFDESTAQVIAVDQVIIHPQYDDSPRSSNVNNHDIALLRLRAPVDFVACGQRCGKIDWLNSQTAANSIVRGTAALISGWGRTVDCQTNPQRCDDLRNSTAGRLLLSPAQLQWARVNIDGCLSGSSRHLSDDITANMLCAAAPVIQQDSCQGDSGGGLTVTATDGRGQVLAGVTSWGRGCAQTGFPAVYTRVSRYDQWIKNRLAGRPSTADRQVSDVDNSAFWRDLNPPRVVNTSSGGGGGSVGFWGLGLLAALGLLRQQRAKKTR